MKPAVRQKSDDWASRQLKGSAPPARAFADERRERVERRRRVFWSIMYGSFNPRRRRPSRRVDDSRFQSLDWHASHLLAVAMGILLLNVADAFLTLELLTDAGVSEANPFMARLLQGNVVVFAGFKTALTSVSVIVMVLLARYRFLRLVRVELVLYGVFLGYVALISYEIGLLRRFADIPLF